nr:iron chelate uptake ABC transporter family permease subunit [Aurantimonas endophytica]
MLVIASLFVGAGDLRTQGSTLLIVSRLPRSLAAILAGAGLAIAGLVMQTLARNRFIEPTTAGTGQSAELGILAVTLLFPSASIAAKAFAASLTALAGTAIFLAAARRLPQTQPALLPLFGLIYGGVIGAGVTFAAWQADLLQYVEVWTSGEFSGVMSGRYELLWVSLLTLALAWWIADRLTLMSLGRDVGLALGLDYRATMRLGLIVVSVTSALVVTVVGTIPFVGLVVGNIVTRMVGDDLKGALPLAALGGAALTLFCDIIARLLRYPYEIPVGTVLGIVGAGVFLWLLFGRPSPRTRHG